MLVALVQRPRRHEARDTGTSGERSIRAGTLPSGAASRGDGGTAGGSSPPSRRGAPPIREKSPDVGPSPVGGASRSSGCASRSYGWAVSGLCANRAACPPSSTLERTQITVRVIRPSNRPAGCADFDPPLLAEGKIVSGPAPNPVNRQAPGPPRRSRRRSLLSSPASAGRPPSISARPPCCGTLASPGPTPRTGDPHDDPPAVTESLEDPPKPPPAGLVRRPARVVRNPSGRGETPAKGPAGASLIDLRFDRTNRATQWRAETGDRLDRRNDVVVRGHAPHHGGEVLVRRGSWPPWPRRSPTRSRRWPSRPRR